MKVTRIKNVVIWALVVINLVFLVFYLWGITAERATRARALRDLTDLFSKNRIALTIKGFDEAGSLQEYSAKRSEPAEQKLAEALLGPATKVDEGGNIFNYYGEKGKATFRIGGEFDATLNPGAVPAGAAAAAAARKLLRDLKIETYSLTENDSSGEERVTAVCAVAGRPVFDCRVVLTFQNGSLAAISGKLVPNLQPTATSAEMSSPATGLIVLLNEVKNGSRSYIFTRIDSAEPGYDLAETSNPGEGRLQPVWRVGTDTGIYIVNAVTRKVEQSIE